MGTTRFEFERAIRALPLRPPVRKLVALMIATYADADGTNAHPGEDRLAAECGITPRAVRGHLAELRQLGLLVRTFNGSQSGRRRLADCYALDVPADVLSRLNGTDHRNDGSGDASLITGTSAPDHRNLSAEHRNEGSKITGTRVPPTITVTKDADHPSPTPTHPPAPSTGGAPLGAAGCISCGRMTNTTRDGDCVACGEPKRLLIHPPAARATSTNQEAAS